MSIAIKVQTAIERASWIRRMFEEGAALVAEHGAENVFDFTLGNPSVEPPEAFHQELRKLALNPVPIAAFVAHDLPGLPWVSWQTREVACRNPTATVSP